MIRERWGRVRLAAALMATACLLVADSARAQCSDPEFCNDAGAPEDASGDVGGSGNAGCWDPELQEDQCNVPPEPCPPESSPTFEFKDDQDGTDDGQIVALNREGDAVGCGTLTVDKTGYYRIYDNEISESCQKQWDETGYLTVENSCNGAGYAVEHNAGPRYLVLDSDNTPECDPAQTGQCAADRECRDGNMGSSCCVPKDPTFMGTFLLVAGEPNKLCLNHWCPEYKVELAAGNDLGFVIKDCEGDGAINSIHFRVDANAIACEEDTTLFPCSFGCEAGKCLPDPCEEKLASGECEAFCKDGICLEDNPCTPLDCEHGCKNGRCLQSKADAVGPDSDGDGYRYTGDCDDDNRYINPGQPELCANGKDDDCDGERDEADCQSGDMPDGPTVVDDAGNVVDAAASDGGANNNNNNGNQVSSGCNCRLSEPPSGLILLLLALLLLGTRSRR